MLVRFTPGINIRLRCGAAIRNLQPNASGCSVACIGTNVAILGDSDITTNNLDRNRKSTVLRSPTTTTLTSEKGASS
jgi:hypothetical protein